MSIRDYSNKDLLFELVRTNFKIKHKNSFLGFIWIFLQPFFHFIILYFVFKYFRGANPDQYLAPKIMYGLVTFNFFRDGITEGSSSLIKYSSIITKVCFKRLYIIQANLLIQLIDYIINMVIATIIFVLIGKVTLTLNGLLFFLLLLIVSTGFIYSLTLFISIIIIIVRDVENILKLVFQGLFWLSGIFYDLETVRFSFRILIYLNPISYIIDSVKKLMIGGEISNLYLILILSAGVFLLIPISNYFFRRNIDKVIEYL